MSDLNVVSLSGRLTRDPEVRHTQSGTVVVDMGLAFSTSRKQGDQWVEDSHFADLTAWGNRGEFFARKLRKGDLVFVHGELRYSSWETSDGSKRSKLTVTVKDLKSQALFRKDDDVPAASAPSDDRYVPAASSDDDIPF
jgi:single-strand DNA-binding protein